MEKHIFDRSTRIPQLQAEALECEPWLPPMVGDGGHLVHAEPRSAQRREGVLADQASTAAQSDAEREEAKKQGYDAGFAEGLSAGKLEGQRQGEAAAQQAAQTQLSGKLQNLNQLLSTLTQSLNEEDYKLEQTLLLLVQQIAEAVIQQELKLDPGILMRVIREAISAMPAGQDRIGIRINPADKELLDDAISQGGENWRAIVDESVTHGGCLIETDQCEADCTLEERIARILAQLDEQKSTAPVPGDPDYEAAPAPAVPIDGAQTPPASD